MTKTDNELMHEIQRLGPIALGSEIWPHLDLALWYAARLGGSQRLVIQGNSAILGLTVEPEQVVRLIARCTPRWATTGVYP
jgi:hypothetical protein